MNATLLQRAVAQQKEDGNYVQVNFWRKREKQCADSFEFYNTKIREAEQVLADLKNGKAPGRDQKVVAGAVSNVARKPGYPPSAASSSKSYTGLPGREKAVALNGGGCLDVFTSRVLFHPHCSDVVLEVLFFDHSH